MVRMRKMRLTGCVACLLILLMQLTPATQVLAAKPIPVPVQRVLVMPFATGDDVADANLGPKIGHTLAAVLRNTPGFGIVDYSKRHPSLQRAALVENTLTDKDLADPSGTSNLDLAAKIAREMGADLVIIGDVDTYKYDAAANTCEIQMTTQLVAARSGHVDKTLVITGQVPKTAKVASEEDCASVAAGDAVGKIAEGLALKAPPTMVVAKATAPETKRKSKKNTLLISLILGLGIGLAVTGGSNTSGGSGGGGGGGIDDPPPLPQ